MTSSAGPVKFTGMSNRADHTPPAGRTSIRCLRNVTLNRSPAQQCPKPPTACRVAPPSGPDMRGQLYARERGNGDTDHHRDDAAANPLSPLID